MNDVKLGQEKEKEKKKYFPIKINFTKALKQKKINIQSIDIYFPYEPYPPQKIYMEKVISTLNETGSISGLESPTGTGKTLCLLCSVLAWVKHNNKHISIYYCTRTVSQINNVLKELNKTCYELNISLLTSRKFTCLKFSKKYKKKVDHTRLSDICDNYRRNYWIIKNEEENKNKNKLDLDEDEKKLENEKKLKLQTCEYYKEEDFYNKICYKGNNSEDIEDLLKVGIKEKFCPYLYNIYKTKSCANLTIMTYTYILDPYIREMLDIFEKNSIVIIDEAHNFCDNLEKFDSKKISLYDLRQVKKLLQVILDFINLKKGIVYEKDEYINPLVFLDNKEINNEINIIKDFINEIEELNFDEIKQCRNYDFVNQKYYICDIDFFKEKFKYFQTHLYSDIHQQFNKLENKDKKEINKFYIKSKEYDGQTRLSSLMKLLHKISEFLIHLDTFYIPNNQENETESLSAAPIQSEIKDQNEIINDEKDNCSINNKNDISEEDSFDYKRIIKGDDINSFRFVVLKEGKKVIFEIICLDASYGLKEYLKINPYSTILTSGTLSIKSSKNLLKTKFFEELNNDHVIQNNQFKINIINGYQLNNVNYNYSFTYKNRDNLTQIISLGNQIYNLANSVKIGGVLVFFQSFEYLEKCHRIWLNNGIIKKYELIKDVIFDISINKVYSEKRIIKDKKNHNLLLFTVYRGKNSEGIIIFQMMRQEW